MRSSSKSLPDQPLAISWITMYHCHITFQTVTKILSAGAHSINTVQTQTAVNGLADPQRHLSLCRLRNHRAHLLKQATALGKYRLHPVLSLTCTQIKIQTTTRIEFLSHGSEGSGPAASRSRSRRIDCASRIARTTGVSITTCATAATGYRGGIIDYRLFIAAEHSCEKSRRYAAHQNNHRRRRYQ